MDSNLHGFIKFCKLLRNPENHNTSPSESSLSATEVGNIIEVLRLLRSGFASKNTRSGEPAEGLQSSYVEGALIESAAKNRKFAALKQQLLKQKQQQQKQQSDNSNNNSNKNAENDEILAPIQCLAQDAAQVLLFDRSILADSSILHHAADFMTLFERTRRRERLLSTNQWSDGETLPLRLSLPPCFNLLPMSIRKSSSSSSSSGAVINEWQQYTYLLLASSGVWSRSMSAENYLKVENMIGSWTGAFDPHELFKASSSPASLDDDEYESFGGGGGGRSASALSRGGGAASTASSVSGGVGGSSSSSSSFAPTAASLPPTATWRMAGMLAAALTRAISGSRQQAFTLFNKIVISTIERPPHRPSPPSPSGNNNNNNNNNNLTPLSVARFIIDSSRLAQSNLDPLNSTSVSGLSSDSIVDNNSSNNNNNKKRHRHRHRHRWDEKSPRISSLAVAIADLTGVSSVDAPINPHHLFEASCILSSLTSSGGNTAGSEGDAPVVHTHGQLNTPVHQEISFDVNGGAVPGVSVTTTVAQEVEYTAALGWARRAARAIWQNENVSSTSATSSKNNNRQNSPSSSSSTSSIGVGSGIRRTLTEWVALAIAVRIADVPILINSNSNSTTERKSTTHSSSSSSTSSSEEENNNNQDEDYYDSSTTNSNNRPTVPVVIPQTVQHVTIDTSSGSDEDALFNINNTADVDPTSTSPIARALNKTHLQAAHSQSSGIRNKPGTVAGRRLLQRSLEAVFPKTSSSSSSNNNNNNTATSAAGSPGRKGRRQYPSDSGGTAEASSSSSSPSSSSPNNNNNQHLAVPDAVSQTVFGSEFANHLAHTIKQLRLVGTADAAVNLASVVGDTRAACRLFQEPVSSLSPTSSSSSSAAREDPSFTYAKNLLQAWNRHRGYRSTLEHGSSEVDQTNNNNNNNNHLPPQQILLARYMGKCLEESLRHTAAVASAIVSHSIARTCTEVPAALKTHNNHHHSHGSSSISSIPELKPAETTLSPGVWSVFTSVSKANELIQATRKLIAKLVEEEEYVRVSMNQAIGMSTLDRGIAKAKKNLVADAKDLSSADGDDPEIVRQRLEQRKRVMQSKKEKQQQLEKERERKRLMKELEERERQEKLQQQQRKKLKDNEDENDEKSGAASGNNKKGSGKTVTIVTPPPPRPKPRPKLFTEEELMLLNDDDLDVVLSSLARTEQGLRNKIDETKTADQEASATLSKAEILVREREMDLKNAEVELERDNQEYQRKLQNHLEELVESERQTLHLVERHSRHAWRIENEFMNNKNQASRNFMRRRSSIARLGGGNSMNNNNNSIDGIIGQEIDIDGFLQKDPRFAYMMDEEELENMMYYNSNSGNDDENQDDDDILSNDNSPHSQIIDHFKKQKEQGKMILSADAPSQQKLDAKKQRKLKQQSKVGLLPCCFHKQRKLHHLQSAIAEIDHSLMGIPFSGWSAGVRQQLSVAENSVECPPSTIEDGLPEGMEWSHIVSIDTFEAGDSDNQRQKSGSGAANALIDLIAEAEATTLRLKREIGESDYVREDKQYITSKKEFSHAHQQSTSSQQQQSFSSTLLNYHHQQSQTDDSAAPLLLPPPIRSGDRTIAKMTGESALYVVASSVAIPKHRRHHRSSTSALMMNEEEDEFIEELSSSSSSSESSSSDNDTTTLTPKRLRNSSGNTLLEPTTSSSSSVVKKTLRQRVNHGFAGLIGLNDTTKLDKIVAAQQQEQQESSSSSSTATTMMMTESMCAGTGAAALAVADSSGRRKNRFIRVAVKGETSY